MSENETSGKAELEWLTYTWIDTGKQEAVKFKVRTKAEGNHIIDALNEVTYNNYRKAVNRTQSHRAATLELITKQTEES
jgi:hypothetical protein